MQNYQKTFDNFTLISTFLSSTLPLKQSCIKEGLGGPRLPQQKHYVLIAVSHLPPQLYLSLL